MSNNSVQLTHRFDAPKGRPFHGWAGVIFEWPVKTAPNVDFGIWKVDPSGGGTVTFQCRPFQLCMLGANSREMQVRDKFTYFAFAGLGNNGNLVLQRLPQDTDARAVFSEGGWKPPAIDDIVASVKHACSLELEEMETEICAVKRKCIDGFGMNLGHRPNELRFFDVLASWQMLAPLHTAFLLAREKQERLGAERGLMSANARKVRLENVLAEMRAANAEISPLTVAFWMMGISSTDDTTIPYKVKDKAKRLQKEFFAHFPGEFKV